MGSVIILVVIGLCIAGIVWRRRLRRQAFAAPASSAGASQEDVVLSTFAHGNSLLAAGQFPEAITAFQKVLALAPKHPHAAGRLAEVTRRQQAASATPPVNTAV